MTTKTRTDVHRPSQIIPAHYTQWNDYALAGNDGCPALGVDCSAPYTRYDAEGRAVGIVTPTCPDTGRCCVRSTECHVRQASHQVFGHAGKCGVCGAHFRHGAMFMHESGELVHMGSDCAMKYEMLMDRSEFELSLERTQAAHATQLIRAAKAEDRAEFCAMHPGLVEAFEIAAKSAADLGLIDGDDRIRAHTILADLHAKFVRFTTMSDKQVAFALKLATQITTPPTAKPVEIKATAPTGKGVLFTGEIVSIKLGGSEQWGLSLKATIKVTNEDGSVWLAWGTLPKDMEDLAEHIPYRGGQDRTSMLRDYFRGLEVDVKATLEGTTSRPCRCTNGGYDQPGLNCTGCKGTGMTAADPSFVFMKRPSMTVSGLYKPTRAQYKAPKVAKTACTKCNGGTVTEGATRCSNAYCETWSATDLQ